MAMPDDVADVVRRVAGIHRKIADDVFARTGKGGRVWCLRCGATIPVDAAECLRSGWPECCGETMTIDPPEASPDA